LLERAGEFAARGRKPERVALVMDRTVAELYGALVEKSFSRLGCRVEPYIPPPGEEAKSMKELSCLLEFLAEHEISGGDLLAAFGGGVTGDLTGFAASVYRRGVGYIQIPTTLLAAVDSSVGGKTAVNLRAGKNLAGAYWQPSMVLCDCDAFLTLPEEELSTGSAECVKYAMLANPALLGELTANGLGSDWEGVVESCARLKADFVARDERGKGVRNLLNFGHTVGHAAERCAGYALRHGEGVAMGMMVMTRAARKMGFCERETETRLQAALRALKLPVECPFPPDALAQAALVDKKREGSLITLVRPRSVGNCELTKLKIEELEDYIRLGMEE